MRGVRSEGGADGSGRRKAGITALTLTILAGIGACDPTPGPSTRDQAEVEIRALASADSIGLVTSTDFAISPDGRVLLLRADTQRVGLPFARIYPLDGLDRFFIEASPAAPGDTASIRMEVRIDGRDWYDEQATLGLGDPGVLAFVYRFSVPQL